MGEVVKAMAKLQAEIGSLGHTLGELRPSGKVTLLGTIHEARSEGQWIEAGKQVVVVRCDAFGLVVREATAEQATALGAAEQQRQQNQAREGQRLAWLQHRQRLFHLATGAALGALLGVALVYWLRDRAGNALSWSDAAYPAAGLLLGVVYGSGLQAFHNWARDELSESWPERPGILGRIVLPALGCAGGAWLGLVWSGVPGATIGAVAGGLLLAPVLTTLFIVIGNLAA